MIFMVTVIFTEGVITAFPRHDMQPPLATSDVFSLPSLSLLKH